MPPVREKKWLGFGCDGYPQSKKNMAMENKIMSIASFPGELLDFLPEAS